MGTGIGRGGERTLRGGKRTEEDGNGTRRRKKPGIGTGQNKDFEQEEIGTLRRRKKGIGNHVILKPFFGKMRF